MTLYLAETSAWHRASHLQVDLVWESRLIADALATCAQARLEILYSGLPMASDRG